VQLQPKIKRGATSVGKILIRNYEMKYAHFELPYMETMVVKVLKFQGVLEKKFFN